MCRPLVGPLPERAGSPLAIGSSMDWVGFLLALVPIMAKTFVWMWPTAR